MPLAVYQGHLGQDQIHPCTYYIKLSLSLSLCACSAIPIQQLDVYQLSPVREAELAVAVLGVR